jgi:hypothetical protein
MHPMADPMTPQLQQAWWSVAQAGGLALLTALPICVSANGPQAAVAPMTTAAQDQPHPLTVELSYQESVEYITWERTVAPVRDWEPAQDTVPGGRSSAKGSALPPLSGLLKLTDLPTNHTTFVWDAAARRLSVDLNRNGDLTDDPQGVFTAAAACADPLSQTFTSLVVTCREPFGSYRLRLDLTLGCTGSHDQVDVETGLRSCYGGRLEVNGQPWQVWVVLGKKFGGPDIYLRPWDQGQTPALSIRLWTDRFRLAEALFLQDTLFQPALAPVHGQANDRLQLILTPRPVELGELRLTGQHVERLVLRGTNSVLPLVRNHVLLFRPEATVKVPTGTYRYEDCRVWLRKGRTYGRGVRYSRDPLRVTSQKAAAVDVGGPLTNWAFAIRHGGCLVFEHAIFGSGGWDYQVLHERAGIPELPPASFTVYRGSKAIKQGAFDRGPFR